MHKTFRTAAISFVLLLGAAGQASADGLAFGWDSDAAKETIYKVNLSSGAVTSLGTVNGLSNVVVGSHDADTKTGYAMMVGGAGSEVANTLYAVLPGTGIVYGFKFPALSANTTIKKSFIRPTDGAAFLMTFNRDTNENEIFQANLNASSGTAQLQSLGTIQLTGVPVDGAKMGSDGVIYLVDVGQSATRLLMFDTQSGDVSELSMNGEKSYSAIFACDGNLGSVDVLALAQVRSEPFTLIDVLNATELSASVNVPSYVAGSSSCHDANLHLLGNSDSRTDPSQTLYTIDVATPGTVSSKELNSSNLKVFFELDSKVKLKTAVSGPAANVSAKASSVKVVSSTALKKCAASLGNRSPLPKSKKGKFRMVAKALSKLRFKGTKCSLS